MLKSSASITATKNLISHLKSQGIKVIRDVKDLSPLDLFSAGGNLETLSPILNTPGVYLPKTKKILIRRKKDIDPLENMRIMRAVVPSIDRLNPRNILFHEGGHTKDFIENPSNLTDLLEAVRSGNIPGKLYAEVKANKNAIGFINKFELPGQVNTSINDFIRNSARVSIKSYKKDELFKALYKKFPEKFKPIEESGNIDEFIDNIKNLHFPISSYKDIYKKHPSLKTLGF